ncbi:hypothetical protein CHCC5023_2249 [Bacillus paralicheniformis]|nr:hypothetical protein CHCC5023_2249 [Bacillus paralicheniformis]TWJ71327.1 hypothetical protein CHCC5019_0131 [Bacillus paralicheniformis]
MSNRLDISYKQGGKLSVCDEKRGRAEFLSGCLSWILRKICG